MPPATAPASAPPKRKRLGSLRQSSLGPPRPKPVARPAPTQDQCCDNPKPEDDGDGHVVCRNCFTQIQDSNIVADVTFQEDSRGQATVQGGFIGENARHAKTLGSAAYRRVGGAQKNTMQEVENTGRRQLAALCPRLGIPETVSGQATQIFLMASAGNFSAGRRTDEVVAACLYAACRRQKENMVLLIDIAELLKLNVFRLGEVYKALCTALYLDERNPGGVGTQYLVEVESLVMKYCRRLEFGDATRQVAEDAAKIIRRMKRDWMVYGRHPAGLCGASIILAARMNNFRRTIREIVYVAKVADMTIAKRVEEFRRTRSAAMTVDQFRKYGVRLKHTHDPPVLTTSQIQKEKFAEKKRKRQEASLARETIDISDDGSDAASREASAAATTTPAAEPEVEQQARRSKRQRTSTTQPATPAPTQQEPRRDADGFLIPPLPVDAITTNNVEQQPKKRGRGRPRKDEVPEVIAISEEELATEAEIEKEIEFALNDDEIIDSRTEVEKAKDEERSRLLAEEQMKAAAEETKNRRAAEGMTWFNEKPTPLQEEVTAEELEEEFADDPEVINCKLSAAEQIIKEQIWVHMNEDWLRSQHEKELINKVARASGREKPKKGKPRKKKGKMGDGTTIAETTTPIENAADANKAMLDKRAPPNYSKFINYETLKRIYRHSPSTSTSGSRAGSSTPAPSGEGGASSSSPPDRLQTPPATQPGAATSASPETPSRNVATPAQPPRSPSQERFQLRDLDPEDLESEGEPGDYNQDELDYGSDDGYGDVSEREDIGEDDYNDAINHPTGRYGYDDEFGGDDDDY